MKKILLSTAIFIVGISAFTVKAASVPRQVAADHHVKIVPYDVNNVVVLNSRFGYQTQITFAANETVQCKLH